MRHRSQQLIIVLATLFFTLWPAIALASSARLPANVSGLELFPGIRSGDIVYGAIFAGWVGGTGVNPSGWEVCSSESTCADWGIIVNYQGTAGTGSSVDILGGVWSLNMPRGPSYYGSVIGGKVVWPPDLSTSIGCGPGVATVSIDLTFKPKGTGSVQGCLDDTHLATVFPPHVWGTISKN